MSFYLTLPSDSSMNYFADNKISHFVTRLPVPLELNGEWEVGLVEFMYPHTWHNINAQNNLIGFDLGDGKEIGRRIPPGCYESVTDILKAITIKDMQDKISFTFNHVTKRVRIRVKNNARVILYTGIAEMLGFRPTVIASTNDRGDVTIESEFAADPSSHFKVLFVYTDIVDPQVVGDVLAPLLRIVKVTGSDGDVVSALYDRPHYLPLSRKNIETLEIVIRMHTGELTPFQFGRSYVTLHFRQKYLP